MLQFKKLGMLRKHVPVSFLSTITEEHSFSDVSSKQEITKKIIQIKKEDSTLSKYMLKVKSSKLRHRHGMIVLEGKRLIKDAILAGLTPSAIFFSKKSDIEDLSLPTCETKLYKTSYSDLKLWSGLTTCPGIIGFAKFDGMPEKVVCDSNLPITVICDQIRDPGNLGSVIRSSAAAGAKQIVLIKGCADPWDIKVLRGGSGAHFRVPLYTGVTWDNIREHIVPGSSVYLADSSSEAEPENHLPTEAYNTINIEKGSDSVIVIGGETSGLSKEAVSFASSRSGKRLHIPLTNNVESLNSAIALSIIIFEFKRQLTNHVTK